MNQYVIQRVLGARDVETAGRGAVIAAVLKLLPIFLMTFARMRLCSPLRYLSSSLMPPGISPSFCISNPVPPFPSISPLHPPILLKLHPMLLRLRVRREPDERHTLIHLDDFRV